MRDNNHNYRERRSYRQQEETPVAKKLMEQFLTQLIICAIATSFVYGAHRLQIEPIEDNIQKVKTAFSYSPSWSEYLAEVKNLVSNIFEITEEK